MTGTSGADSCRDAPSGPDARSVILWLQRSGLIHGSLYFMGDPHQPDHGVQTTFVPPATPDQAEKFSPNSSCLDCVGELHAERSPLMPTVRPGQVCELSWQGAISPLGAALRIVQA